MAYCPGSLGQLAQVVNRMFSGDTMTDMNTPNQQGSLQQAGERYVQELIARFEQDRQDEHDRSTDSPAPRRR
jgi:hypothetical protein